VLKTARGCTAGRRRSRAAPGVIAAVPRPSVKAGAITSQSGSRGRVDEDAVAAAMRAITPGAPQSHAVFQIALDVCPEVMRSSRRSTLEIPRLPAGTRDIPTGSARSNSERLNSWKLRPEKVDCG